jgi:hypothetical protein
MAIRRQRILLVLGSLSAVTCGLASYWMSTHWRLALAGWLGAIATAVPVIRRGDRWRRVYAWALVGLALLALVAAAAFVGVYFYGLRDI